MTPSPSLLRLAGWCDRVSGGLNWLVERLCAFLLLVLILDVWLGVLARYVLPFNLTFTEELARYLMIWTALLAVSAGIARREHIGVLALFEALPPRWQRWLLSLLDLLAFVFFAILFYYGLGLVEKGTRQVTMVFATPKSWPFAAVPAGALLACIQLLLVGIRDHARPPGSVEPGHSDAPTSEA